MSLRGTPFFSTAFKAALDESGMSLTEVGRRIGMTRGTIRKWRDGGSIPQNDPLQLLADLLMAPQLIDAALRARTGKCRICGALVVSSIHRLEYCSRTCRDTANNRRRRGIRERRGVVERHRLDLYQEAVAAFCRECEPDGVCKTPECPLRDVSPLRLARAA